MVLTSIQYFVVAMIMLCFGVLSFVNNHISRERRKKEEEEKWARDRVARQEEEERNKEEVCNITIKEIP